MNKIDAFFVMFSLLLVWLFAVYLLPTIVTLLVYAMMGVWWLGTSIGRLPSKLAKETDRDFVNYLLETQTQQNELLNEMLEELKRRGNLIGAAKAKIDQLMFEYCPEEMTPEQIANYEAYVKVASQQQEEEVNIALLH